MYVRLSQQWQTAQKASEIIRKCVHCGMCNATCPTYQTVASELDGPRGRIYLIKNMLEGQTPSQESLRHLDRCLLCRACESTCPAGVRYHDLLDFGRTAMGLQVKRPWRQRVLRNALSYILPQAKLARLLIHSSRLLKPVLPQRLAKKLPKRQASVPYPSARTAYRKRVLLIEGCVQPALSPQTDAHCARILDQFGVGVIRPPQATCCGAIEYHMGHQERAKLRAQRNIKSWWPLIETGVDAIIQTASGCHLHLAAYGELFDDDPTWRERAQKISSLTIDPSQLLHSLQAEQPANRPNNAVATTTLAVHIPCTQQHGLRVPSHIVPDLLTQVGYRIAPSEESHLCCGSAGTYSLTEPKLARQLGRRKIAALTAHHPQGIATANIGCQNHLSGESPLPVKHWLEWYAEALFHTSN